LFEIPQNYNLANLGRFVLGATISFFSESLGTSLLRDEIFSFRPTNASESILGNGKIAML